GVFENCRMSPRSWQNMSVSSKNFRIQIILKRKYQISYIMRFSSGGKVIGAISCKWRTRSSATAWTYSRRSVSHWLNQVFGLKVPTQKISSAKGRQSVQRSDKVTCKTSKQFLARIENGMLFLWCKRCSKEHQFSEQELLRLLRESKEANVA